MGRWWMGAACAAGLMGIAAPAGAEPATANAIQLGAGFRYGFELEEGDLNPWATGLGIDLGYTLSNGVFFGGGFEYFFGSTEETEVGETTANLWQIMARGGYDVGLGDSIVLRPKLEAGMASPKFESCLEGAPCVESSDTYFAAGPAGSFLLLTRSFSLTLDVRYELIFADPETLNGLIFSVGIGF